MKIHHIQFHHIIIVHSVPSCFHYAPFSSIIFHSVPTCSIQFQHHHNSSSKSYSIFTFFQKRHHLSSKSIRQIINIHENPFHIQLFNYPLHIQFMFRSIFHSVNHWALHSSIPPGASIGDLDWTLGRPNCWARRGGGDFFSGEDGWISHGFPVSFHWCNQWFSPGFLWLSCWWGGSGWFQLPPAGLMRYTGDIMTLIMAMLLHQSK